MEALFKYISALALSVAALFAPIAPLVGCVTLFIAIDFATGILASRAVARRTSSPWWFESRQAWHTVAKLGFTLIAIAMAWLIESCILDFVTLNLAKLFTGFTCGVELWSFLENVSQISDAKLFAWLRRYVHHRLEREVGGNE